MVATEAYSRQAGSTHPIGMLLVKICILSHRNYNFLLLFPQHHVDQYVNPTLENGDVPHTITVDQKKDIVSAVPNGTNTSASRSQTPEPELLPVRVNKEVGLNE